MGHRSACAWCKLVGNLGNVKRAGCDVQGRSGLSIRVRQSARPDQFLQFSSKAVLLRRVAYSTGLTCTIESTGMCVGLQCTLYSSIDQRYDYGFLGDCASFGAQMRIYSECSCFRGYR